MQVKRNMKIIGSIIHYCIIDFYKETETLKPKYDQNQLKLLRINQSVLINLKKYNEDSFNVSKIKDHSYKNALNKYFSSLRSNKRNKTIENNEITLIGQFKDKLTYSTTKHDEDINNINFIAEKTFSQKELSTFYSMSNENNFVLFKIIKSFIEKFHSVLISN